MVRVPSLGARTPGPEGLCPYPSTLYTRGGAHFQRLTAWGMVVGADK